MGKTYLYAKRRPGKVVYLDERRTRLPRLRNRPPRAFSRLWERKGSYASMSRKESAEICRAFGIARRGQVNALMTMAGFIREGREDNAKEMVGKHGLTEAHLNAAACHCLRKEISSVKPTQVNFDRLEALFAPYGLEASKIGRIAAGIFEKKSNEGDFKEAMAALLNLKLRSMPIRGNTPF